MGHSIVDIKNMGDALRNTGYKNIESAVSEIIDNSIEAGASNIFIILNESLAASGRKVISEIGFLDNGTGMDSSVLGSCLGIGSSTRHARKGMGRFGVGLPQASLYACPEIEVFSWQDGIQNAKKVFLDINMIKDGSQTEIEDPAESNLPKKYAKFINYSVPNKQYDFSKSGTLVIWNHIDRIQPKTRGPLTDRLEFALGQKFRYFIHDNLCEIKIVSIENEESAVNVAPNDPLFLMDDNRVLCDPDDPQKIYRPGQRSNLETPFELYTAKGSGNGDIQVPIKYINQMGEITTRNIRVRFSIVKNKFYDKTAFPAGKDPGKYALGKHAAKLEGISIIRANREIDFGRFDFYSVINEPQHRWWGCEIIFDPELDEAFGVANNKQYVELKEIDPQDIDTEERDVQPVWLQLAGIIKNTIKQMYNENKEKRETTRSFPNIDNPTTDIINAVENDPANQDDNDESKEDSDNKDKKEEAKKELTDLGFDNPTDEEVAAFISNHVNIVYADKGVHAPAFDYKSVLDTTLITINTSHKFYQLFLQKIYSNADVKVTFELFLASILHSMCTTDSFQSEQNDRLILTWFTRLNNYISEQINPRNTH